ncbi:MULTISPECIES: DMT family transporter [unclassified Vibrio]|uniref:DMT family transporter n=1 Tax=Vibrio sp. HB236076 TaxID=3232307 RepID=A0AB39HF84_9VIBR|nr:DMT family transporter [Vibrio sp. HB161653]MDP5255298.1 DMT family transporter [Vibrio sp. HB161653]
MSFGYFCILISTLFFSSIEIVLKLVSADFNPLELNFLRFAIGSAMLFPLALRSLKRLNMRIEARHWPRFLFTGFLCVVVSMTCFQLAISYTQASIVAILFSCNAVFVIPLAHVLLKQTMNWVSVGSLLLSVVGMIFILNPEHMPNTTGVILALLSALAFALYGITGQVGQKKYGYNGLVLTFFSFFAGSLEMLLLMSLTHLPIVSEGLTSLGLAQFSQLPIIAGISWQSLPTLIYLGIFATGFGYACYFMAMERTSAATTSVIFYIKPALAPILALPILGEVLHINTVIGIGFIIAGSALMLCAKPLIQWRNNLRTRRLLHNESQWG